MSKMFKTVTQTWNPFTGCRFGCTYCWAKKLALGKCKYPDFAPTFRPERLNKKFKADDFVFVSSMGDISFASFEAIDAIQRFILNSPATFLIQTKRPDIFAYIGWDFENVYHGLTLETNKAIPNISLAPLPQYRYLYFTKDDKHPHKFLSIEPVMDFDLDIFLSWIKDINPEIIEIGADNYHNNLPEPSPEKLAALLRGMEDAGLNVKQKDGLSRLLEVKK
jgi:hypothetical protein